MIFETLNNSNALPVIMIMFRYDALIQAIVFMWIDNLLVENGKLTNEMILSFRKIYM